MRSFASYEVDAGATFVWTTRVRGAGSHGAVAYARTHTIPVHGQASFAEADPSPCAVEYVLAALGGDLVSGFGALAARRAAAIDALEATISGRLNNPLVFLGSVGETGHPGIEEISGTLHVAAKPAPHVLEEIWAEVLERSPVYNTLRRCTEVSVEMQVAL